MQLHQPLVLRQAVKLFLGVPPMQGFNHLVQLYHLLLQLDQAKVLGVRDLERTYKLMIISKGICHVREGNALQYLKKYLLGK